MAATITAPLAPLTTIFTPPCSTSWLLTSSKDPSQFPSFPTGGPASCDPPFWASNIADKGFQYYSPAICPSGFEVGPGCQVRETRTAEGFPVVEPDETAAYCVPSGFTCTTDTTDFRGGVWGATKEAGPPLFTVGPALQIRFQESDLSMLETHPLTPGLTLAGLPAQVSVSASASAGPAGSMSATATFGQFTMTPSPTPPSFVGTPAPTTISETSRAGSPAAPSNMTTLSTASSTATVQPSKFNTIDSKGQSSTSIAAIVLSTLLTLLAIAFTVYACSKGRHWRGWRVSMNRRRKGFKSVGVGVWIGTRASRDNDEEEPYEQQRTANTTRSSTPDTPPRLSLPPGIRSSPTGRLTLPHGWSPPETEGGIRIPIFRQGQDNRQVKVPGAELLDDGTPSRHGSWVSRVSRMLSRAARSSTTTRSRSSSRSRSRSARGGAPSSSRRPPSEEWEHFFQGSLTVPHLTYSRPSSMASSASSFPGDRKDDYYFDLEGAARRLPKTGSFDRLSNGTFGLRGRSRDRSAKRKS